MGTRFEVVLAADVCADARAAGEAAIEEIEIWHRRLSRFASDSLVSHLNREAASGPVRLDAETFALFADAVAVWQASDGAFDVACAPLVARRGFAPSAVASGAPWVGSAAIELDAREWTIRFGRPGVSLDLGGIGKGHALECAADVLRSHGVASALIHGGTSSVVAIGAPPDADGWRVALAGAWNERVLTLRDTALGVSSAGSQVSTSGTSHIVDPRPHARRAGPDGAPRGAAVIGPSARLADAWATALVVLGRVPEAFPPGYEALLEDGHATWATRITAAVSS